MASNDAHSRPVACKEGYAAVNASRPAYTCTNGVLKAPTIECTAIGMHPLHAHRQPYDSSSLCRNVEGCRLPRTLGAGVVSSCLPAHHMRGTNETCTLHCRGGYMPAQQTVVCTQGVLVPAKSELLTCKARRNHTKHEQLEGDR